jgi:hypothetical protein
VIKKKKKRPLLDRHIIRDKKDEDQTKRQRLIEQIELSHTSSSLSYEVEETYTYVSNRQYNNYNLDHYNQSKLRFYEKERLILRQ